MQANSGRFTDAEDKLQDAKNQRAMLEQSLRALEKEMDEGRYKVDNARADLTIIRRQEDEAREVLAGFKSDMDVVRERIEEMTAEADEDGRKMRSLVPPPPPPPPALHLSIVVQTNRRCPISRRIVYEWMNARLAGG